MRDYTHYSAAHKTYTHIDMFLFSQTLLLRISDASIAMHSVSDHAHISLSIRLDRGGHIPARWGLLVGLLHSPATVDGVRAEILEYIQHNDTGEKCLSVVWKTLKAVIRGEFIANSSTDARRRKEVRSGLEKEVAELEAIYI